MKLRGEAHTAVEDHMYQALSSPFSEASMVQNQTREIHTDAHIYLQTGGSVALSPIPGSSDFFQTGMRINNHIVVSYMHPMTSRLCVG